MSVYSSLNAADPRATVILGLGQTHSVTPADLNSIYQVERYRDERFRTEIRVGRLVAEQAERRARPGRYGGAHRRPRRPSAWFRLFRRGAH